MLLLLGSASSRTGDRTSKGVGIVLLLTAGFPIFVDGVHDDAGVRVILVRESGAC